MPQLAIPTPLRKYTNGQRLVATEGATLRAIFDALERDYPGLKFRLIDEQGRVREHIKLFINQRVAPDLDAAVLPTDELRIILAISGG
jgi:molybdopterin converting factor small subunit